MQPKLKKENPRSKETMHVKNTGSLNLLLDTNTGQLLPQTRVLGRVLLESPD